jgi:hypothetical protein
MQVRFGDLPAVVRERFVRLTQMGTADPIVSMTAPGGSSGALSVIGLVVGGLASAAFLAFLMDGVRTPSEYGLAYLLMTVAMAITLASLLGLIFRAIWKGPPYREGLIALPGAVVRSRGEMLEIFPTGQLARPQVVHVRVNGRYARSRVEIGTLHFPYSSQEAANAAASRYVASVQAYAQAWAMGNAQALAPLDPFMECTTTNNWKQPSADGPRAGGMPLFASLGRWVLALVIAGGVSYTLGSMQAEENEARIKAYKKKEAEKKKKAADDE